MRWFSRIGLVSLTVAIGVALSGCNNPAARNWAGGSDGVVQGAIARTIVNLRLDDRAFLILAVEDTGQVTSSSSFGPTSTGEFHMTDGRKIPWSCTTKDGVKGTVKVGDKELDLAKGNVVMVSAKPDIKVEQMTIDLSKVKHDSVPFDLRRAADKEPRLMEFLKVWPGDKQ